jgi:hypothetical protein
MCNNFALYEDRKALSRKKAIVPVAKKKFRKKRPFVTLSSQPLRTCYNWTRAVEIPMYSLLSPTIDFKDSLRKIIYKISSNEMKEILSRLDSPVTTRALCSVEQDEETEKLIIKGE